MKTFPDFLHHRIGIALPHPVAAQPVWLLHISRIMIKSLFARTIKIFAQHNEIKMRSENASDDDDDDVKNAKKINFNLF